MTFLYFAYGSNMLSARLKARCPSAKVIGRATAIGHALEFTKRGKDDSGKATLVSVTGKDIQTPGVLFEVAKADLPKLDLAEGAGYGYDRHDEFQVDYTDESKVAAATYLASAREAHLLPYDWYLALVIAGVDQHQLDAGHAERLRQVEYLADSDLAREGRAEAIAALSAHGFSDYNLLLKRT